MAHTDTAQSSSAPSGSAGSRSARSAAPERGKGLVIGVGVVVALAVLGYGGNRFLYARSHVTTDNAQIEGFLTPVLARTGGFVTEVRVRDNQHVQAGDTLVVLDDRDLTARLAQAEAELSALLTAVGEGGRAEAQVASARAAASAADANVQQARASAQKANADLERITALAARDIVSQQQLDAARAAAEATGAQLLAAERNALAARAQALVAQADVGSADARVEAARAARDQIALQLSYTRVVVPASGVVSKRSADVGQYVQPGQPLMTVVPVSDLWVVANLKETEIVKVRAGEKVEFTVDAYPGAVFEGVVESVSPATGARFSLLPPDNATGNFTKVIQRIPVRIRVESQADPDRPLRPGMSAEVTISVAG